jgi:hypothetical protein
LLAPFVDFVFKKIRIKSIDQYKFRILEQIQSNENFGVCLELKSCPPGQTIIYGISHLMHLFNSLRFIYAYMMNILTNSTPKNSIQTKMEIHKKIYSGLLLSLSTMLCDFVVALMAFACFALSLIANGTRNIIYPVVWIVFFPSIMSSSMFGRLQSNVYKFSGVAFILLMMVFFYLINIIRMCMPILGSLLSEFQ